VKRLVERTPPECFQLHARKPGRVYEDDPWHARRIEKTREAVIVALLDMNKTPVHRWGKIVELGCGTADISGFFSWAHYVLGLEASPTAAIAAAKRYPWMNVEVVDVQEAVPLPCDIVILTEILEHVADPMLLAEKWLTVSAYSVLSCPIDGDLPKDVSAGEHCWSISETDWSEFFERGQHEVIRKEILSLPDYTIAIGVGRRV